MDLSAYSLISVCLKVNIFYQEVTVCYFNEKGVLSKLCKLRVITDKIISETRIRGKSFCLQIEKK